MIKTEDLIDDKTSYSTTRWAFVTAMKFSIVMAVLTLITFIVFRILKIDTEGLFGGVTGIISIPVTLATGAKALQGFERKEKTEDTIEMGNDEKETNVINNNEDGK